MSARPLPTPPDNLAYALRYAELNWKVFPVGARSKFPLAGSHGFKDATTDEATIRGWWSVTPAANIGIATSSQFFALDIDNKSGGFETLEDLQDKLGCLPDTLQQETGGGGRHYIFSAPEGMRVSNSTGVVGQGIDVRGEGGYIVVAPSLHQNGREYRWDGTQEFLSPVLPAPEWVISCMATERGRGLARVLPEKIPNGRRNETLFKIACRYRHNGGDEKEIFNQISIDNQQKCETPLPDSEVRTLVKSACAYPPGQINPIGFYESATSESTVHAAVQSLALNGSEINEDGLAQVFVAKHGHELRYCHGEGWLIWDGARWAPDSRSLAFHWARIVCRELNRNGKTSIAKAATAAGVERLAKSDPVLSTTRDDDKDGFLLGTPDGTVDLRTGAIRQAAKGDLLTKSTAVTPDAQASRPVFNKFLHEITDGDGDLQEYLQLVAGYCLTGSTREEALFFVYGPGGNGKTKFLNALAGAMGDYAKSASMDLLNVSHGERHPADLASLCGARLVTASETQDGRRWDVQRVKQLTGGDPISARLMRQDFFTFKPTFKLVITGNYKPQLGDVDDALRRRFHIIPFNFKPVAPDTQLEEKLSAEWPAILAWAVEGCVQWHGLQRLQKPKVVSVETDKYFLEQNSVEQWIEDNCSRLPGDSARSSHLFSNWSGWAERNGVKPGTTMKLSQRLERLGYQKDKDGGFMVFSGIAVKERRSND